MQVSRKLTIATPSNELVDAYLTEIAKAYSVNWSPVRPLSVGGEDDSGGQAKVCFEYIRFRSHIPTRMSRNLPTRYRKAQTKPLL